MSDGANEPTSKVLFENHQWRVTAYGVESVEPAPTYELSADQLLESERAGYYDWPVHMAEKTWIDIEAFIEAFVNALKLHAGKFDGVVDPTKLTASITMAAKKRCGGDRILARKVGTKLFSYRLNKGRRLVSIAKRNSA
jgi:hypothetical protein